MTRTLASILAASALGAVLAVGPVAAQDGDNVKKIDDIGMDDGIYRWQVRCKDGRRTSISLVDATVLLCATPFNKAKRCAKADAAWTIRIAAAHACS